MLSFHLQRCERMLCCYPAVSARWILDFFSNLSLLWTPCLVVHLLSTLQHNQSADDSPFSDSLASKHAISLTNLSFIWGIIPKMSLFQVLNWGLTYWSFCCILWPAQTVGLFSDHNFLTIFLKSFCWNHMFSNLKGVEPPFRRSISTRIGQWSETGLRRPLKWTLGWFSSHSFVTKNLSILLHEAFILK